MVDTVRLAGRVGMLVYSYYPRDVRVRREAEELAAAGIEVHVICLREPAASGIQQQPKREMIKGVNVHRLPLSRKRGGMLRYFFEFAATAIFGALKLTRLCIPKKFDVVHIHNMPDLLVFAGLIPKWTGATLVLDVHDPMSELFQSNYHVRGWNPMLTAVRFQERISYKFAHHLVTVSQPMAENIAQKINRVKRDIAVIQNFPDLNKFPIREDSIEWPRHEHGFVVLYAGTVTEQYRLDIAVKAVAIAAKNIPNIQLKILAEGNCVLQRVLDLAKELGISERVEHFELVKYELVKDIISKADVGISTHRGGPFGDLYFSTKIVEFLTQGLPVVTSRTKTLVDYLPDDAVFFFEPENPVHCAEQLVAIRNEPALVIRKLEKARALAQRFTWQAERNNLISFYKKLLNSDRAGYGRSLKWRKTMS